MQNCTYTVRDWNARKTIQHVPIKKSFLETQKGKFNGQTARKHHTLTWANSNRFYNGSGVGSLTDQGHALLLWCTLKYDGWERERKERKEKKKEEEEGRKRISCTHHIALALVGTRTNIWSGGKARGPECVARGCLDGGGTSVRWMLRLDMWAEQNNYRHI